MKQFTSIEKIDTGILYILELASSLSVLLLAFGLIASMANVLTKGSVLTDHVWMQQIWAWTQCIAIDAGLAGTILRTFRYAAEGEKVKTWLYGILSVLLLFTAAIVSNIEAVQQTLNITLDAAYMHVFIPVEALIWVRSVVIVLLIVAHAMRHVQKEKPQDAKETAQPAGQLEITPELVEMFRRLLIQVQPTIVTEESEQKQLQAAQEESVTTSEPEREAGTQEQPASTYERVKAYLVGRPDAKIREVSEALTISMSTANKWMGRARKEVKTGQ